MTGYWIRHRLLWSLILSIALALIVGLLFVFPYVNKLADDYNSQSMYRNTEIDFIVPEPSFDQVAELPGTNGIDKVFPYFLTKTEVKAGNKTRTTTILLSDQFQNVDMTMYNDKRLIKKSESEYDDSVMVDWKFCKDTSSKIGDTISFSVGEKTVDCRIYAFYETNSIYDDGAILVKISGDQFEAIKQKSLNNGYSGMFVKAKDYNECHQYFSEEYRPLGRLKDRDQFDTDEQYETHYNAIMSSGFANEITDFRIKENKLDKAVSPLLIVLAVAITVVFLLGVNLFLAKRGCERQYFVKTCIPKGQKVGSYYKITFFFELLASMISVVSVVLYKILFSETYIPKSAYMRANLVYVLAAIVVAEILCLAVNCLSLKGQKK